MVMDFPEAMAVAVFRRRRPGASVRLYCVRVGCRCRRLPDEIPATPAGRWLPCWCGRRPQAGVARTTEVVAVTAVRGGSLNHESVLATLRAGLMDRDRRWSVKRFKRLVGFTDMLSDATSPRHHWRPHQKNSGRQADRPDRATSALVCRAWARQAINAGQMLQTAFACAIRSSRAAVRAA
jgi:hypothetical protein